LLRSIVEATAYAQKPENRKEIAAAISTPNYLNQPLTVVEQVLTGTFADGLGGVKKVPDRAGFDPFPWESFAIWILTQMQRWGQIKGEVDYQKIARDVFLATDARRAMEQAGLVAPASNTKIITVMGKVFDSSKPKEYLDSFAIKKV
jgi:nitrate/nitrite transport system substrate-binding protein